MTGMGMKIRERRTGATAVMREGAVEIRSATGGLMMLAGSVDEAGFNPLDLLYASLSGCLALSARMAATRLGVSGRVTGIEARVTGEKAPDKPARVATFHVDIRIEGDLTEVERQEIIRLAEGEICTISNTLKSSPAFAHD